MLAGMKRHPHPTGGSCCAQSSPHCAKGGRVRAPTQIEAWRPLTLRDGEHTASLPKGQVTVTVLPQFVGQQSLSFAAPLLLVRPCCQRSAADFHGACLCTFAAQVHQRRAIPAARQHQLQVRVHQSVHALWLQHAEDTSAVGLACLVTLCRGFLPCAQHISGEG